MAVSKTTELSGVPIAINASIGPLASCRIFSADPASQLESVSPPSVGVHQTDSPALFTKAIASIRPAPLPQCPDVANAIGPAAALSHFASSASETFLVTTLKPSLAESSARAVDLALSFSLTVFDFVLTELLDLVVGASPTVPVPLGQAANNLGRSAENSRASKVAWTTLTSYSRLA